MSVIYLYQVSLYGCQRDSSAPSEVGRVPLLAVPGFGAEGDTPSTELLRINLPVDDTCALLAVVGGASPEPGRLLCLHASPYQRPRSSRSSHALVALSVRQGPRGLAALRVAHWPDEAAAEVDAAAGAALGLTAVLTRPGVAACLQARAAIARVRGPRRALSCPSSPASAASSSQASRR